MSRQYKIQQSRKIWKTKAIERCDENRYLRRELGRVKNQRDEYKIRAQEAESKSKELEKQVNKAGITDKKALVYVTLQLFIEAHISFRAVSRVLKVLRSDLGLKKAPCVQTVINWVRRLSISRIEHSSDRENTSRTSSNNGLWLIDSSIALGKGKILALLRIDTRYHEYSNGAPKLKDIRCIAVSVALSWTGESIAAFLRKVISQIGQPHGFIKDGGSDLAKGIGLLGTQLHQFFQIDDISHVIANLLKHEYEPHLKYNEFLSVCSKASQRLKQTLLAFLAPPKVRTKARFMNLHRLVKWADQLLKHSPVGRVAQDSFIHKLRQSMEGLPDCKGFIERFLRDSTALLACQKLLKNNGLNFETRRQCLLLIESIPSGSSVRVGLMQWLDKHWQLAWNLGLRRVGLPISTDLLESLFGIAKTLGVGEIKDANRIASHIPALCGSLTYEDVQRALDVSVKHQEQIMGSISSLTKQRRAMLPNPGTLDSGILDEVFTNIELIPSPKNRSKNEIMTNISDDYTNRPCPVI